MAKKNNNKNTEEIKNGGNKMEEKELFAAPENQVEENAESMEMELELDGEEVINTLEEVVAENVQKEEKENKKNNKKLGRKPQGDGDKKEKEEKPKKEKELDLKNPNIIQREIKKGRLSAPHGRIEKSIDGSSYKLLLADGVIFTKDAKYKEFDNISKMNDGKYIVTNQAAKNLGVDRFNAKHENGTDVEHEYVRVELHKPGRDKDVVMLFTVSESKRFLRELNAKVKRKEEEDKKKAEKEAKEKAEKEKENKEEVKEAEAK